MRTPTSRSKYVVVALLAALAVTVGLGQRLFADPASADLSATDRIKAHPSPVLFTDDQVASISADVLDQQAPADASMAHWWAIHGAAVEDTRFLAWVQDQIPLHRTPQPGRRRWRRSSR